MSLIESKLPLTGKENVAPGPQSSVIATSNYSTPDSSIDALLESLRTGNMPNYYDVVSLPVPMARKGIDDIYGTDEGEEEMSWDRIGVNLTSKENDMRQTKIDLDMLTRYTYKCLLVVLVSIIFYLCSHDSYNQCQHGS